MKRSSPGQSPGQSGFTLLEILAALAVTAFALGALWKGLSQGVAVSEGLPDRVMARWVAQNRLVLRQALQDWPEPRQYRGSVEMGGREWHWREQVAATDQPRLRRVTVRVAGEPDSASLFTLEGYLQQPRAGEPPPRSVEGQGPDRQGAGQ